MSSTSHGTVSTRRSIEIRSGVKRSEIISRDGRVYHLGLAPSEVTEHVILVGDPARALAVAACFDGVTHERRHREYVTLTGQYRALPVTVVGTGIGTDNVEIALVELHALHAIDLETGVAHAKAPALTFIRVGTSGGVAPAMLPGTLCIAEYALGFDSTGPYYDHPAADEVVVAIEREVQAALAEATSATSRFRDRLPVYASKADSRVFAALSRHAAMAGVDHATGITASSPGFFGPSSRHVVGLVNTVPDIKGTLAQLAIAGRTVLNMEMESSLLFHLAGALGHRAGTICPAISQPDAAAAVPDYGAAIETSIRIALDALVDVARC